MVMELLRHFPDRLEERKLIGSNGVGHNDSLLVAACRKRLTMLVLHLLSLGANVEADDQANIFFYYFRNPLPFIHVLTLVFIHTTCEYQYGCRSLMVAALANNEEIVIILLDHGADINAKNMVSELKIYHSRHFGKDCFM